MSKWVVDTCVIIDILNGDAQVVMVARKDNGYGTAVFSDSLLRLFKEGL